MLLVVVAVEAEARALPRMDGVRVVVSGIGRTNAAAAVTQSLLELDVCDAVLNVGVCGALPSCALPIGSVVHGTAAVYAEEGMDTPGGFVDIATMGFSLGADEGNVLHPDADLVEHSVAFTTGVSIATVATCSGTDEHAAMIEKRTGAAVEAMEGAAVLHAARRLGTRAIEIRAISNTTGDRDQQQWDMEAALANLGETVPVICKAISPKI